METSDRNEYLVTPVEDVETVRYNVTNIGASAGLVYFLYGQRLMHKVGAGLSYQHGISASKSENYSNDASKYLYWRIFYRNELQINARLSIYIQPTFDHAFYVKEKLNAPFLIKPYSAGVGFGMIYKF